MPRAIILGGAGQIGRAAARALRHDGWDVVVSHRGLTPLPDDLAGLGVSSLVFDRDRGRLADAVGDGADMLLDTIAFDDSHARQLIEIERGIGSFVVISSASVYCDARGRTLDEAAQNGFPELPEPIPETNSTVEPGPATYSTRKVALERELLDRAKAPATVLRACAVYGVGSRHPREWWFVKRMLDDRPFIPLTYEGASRFHTCATVNIAAAALAAARRPGHRILNIADPAAPSVAEIGEIIARHIGYRGRLLKLEDRKGLVGRTPWSAPRPFVVDCRQALDLGYSPAATYQTAAAPVCDWLVQTAGDGPWETRFDQLAAYPTAQFDYAAEDAFVSGL